MARKGGSSGGLLPATLMMVVVIALCFIIYANRQNISPPAVSEAPSPSATTTAPVGSDNEGTAAGSTTVSGELSDEFSGEEGVSDAPFVLSPDRESPYYIVVFLKSQSTAVYARDGAGYYSAAERVFTCSTGTEGHATRCGLHSIYRRYRWRALVGDVYGQYATGFTNSYLFHSVPYLSQDPATLDVEGYYALGSPASHGCVRLCVRDARWIFENCPDGTQVHIVDEAGPAGDAVPPLEVGAVWDPTDTEYLASN